MLPSITTLTMLFLSPFLVYIGCICAITFHVAAQIYFLGGIERWHARMQS